jgi:hypothetical protein
VLLVLIGSVRGRSGTEAIQWDRMALTVAKLCGRGVSALALAAYKEWRGATRAALSCLLAGWKERESSQNFHSESAHRTLAICVWEKQGRRHSVTCWKGCEHLLLLLYFQLSLEES